jgi:hypothetical protein
VKTAAAAQPSFFSVQNSIHYGGGAGVWRRLGDSVAENEELEPKTRQSHFNARQDTGSVPTRAAGC